MSLSPSLPPPADLDTLFEEYLERRESSPNPETQDLLERAQDGRDELSKRIRFYESVRRTADFLRVSDEEVEASDLAIPDQIENYQNLEPIGRGGQARVYKGYDSLVGREVAIKFLRLERVSPDEVDRLLKSEAQALGRLTQSCVVNVHSFAKFGAVPYMVMEYVLAPNLREVIDALAGISQAEDDPRPDGEERNKLLKECARQLSSLPARTRFLTQLAEALEYCHTEGVLHRDVKPENVLVAQVDGQFVPRLVDFGLSFSDRRDERLDPKEQPKLSDRFMVTLAYSAPEQLAFERLGSSPKAEQFALATVAYELLTGVHPFDGKDDPRGRYDATRENVLDANPASMRSVNREIPTDLESIVNHALEREPEDRYPRVGDFARDLDALLSFRSLSIQRSSPWREAKLFLRRNRASLIRGGLGVLLVLAVPFLFFASKARSVRFSLRSEFANLRQESEDWKRSPDFEAGWQELSALAVRGEELDSTFFWPLLFGSMEREEEASSSYLSKRMEESMTAQVEARSVFKKQDMAALREVNELWKVPLTLKSAHRPQGLTRLGASEPANKPFRLRLDEVTTLVQRQVAPERFSFGLAFSPREVSEETTSGAYRYTSWADPGDPIAEFEFEVLLPRQVEMTPPGIFPRERLEEMLFVERFSADFFYQGSADENGVPREGSMPLPYPIQGPAFYLSERVTWSELAQVLGSTVEALVEELRKRYAVKGELPIPEEVLQPDSPALASPRIALRYAHALGARLPSVSELLFAYDTELLQDLPLSEDWKDRLEGELTGTYNLENRMFMSIYPEKIDRFLFMPCFNSVDPGRSQALLHFRIARTSATKAELEKR